MTKLDIRNAPRVVVKFLWHNDWWDGPLAGICECKNNKYWYMLHHENYKKGAKYWRRFVVLELTPEQLTEEEKWHQLFVENVGAHFTCDENGQRKRGELRPYHLHHEFYDEFNKVKDDLRVGYDKNSVVGYFDL